MTLKEMWEIDVGMKIRCIFDALRSTNRGVWLFRYQSVTGCNGTDFARRRHKGKSEICLPECPQLMLNNDQQSPD
jgi:hypothetical protein